MLFVEKKNWWLLRRVTDLWSTACKTLPKVRCHPQISSYRIDLMSANGPISAKQCYHEMDYRLVSNIRCTSYIRCTQTLGHSQLEFSPTTILAKISNTRRTHMVWAAPSGLRFWLTMDHRTNDSSSVCGECEVYYIGTRCEPLYPKCNCISSNKSMNMTLSSPIHRPAPFCWLSRDPYHPDD